jgi:Asp-tRNA(Asn)/Glu-tRNA(Gln) amidotransferase B subunit
VPNREAIHLAMRAGLALGCEIERQPLRRKNYFYPDLAKGYQISQFELPLNAHGRCASRGRWRRARGADHAHPQVERRGQEHPWSRRQLDTWWTSTARGSR